MIIKVNYLYGSGKNTKHTRPRKLQHLATIEFGLDHDPLEETEEVYEHYYEDDDEAQHDLTITFEKIEQAKAFVQSIVGGRPYQKRASWLDNSLFR